MISEPFYFGCCILNFEWIRTAPGIGAVFCYVEWVSRKGARGTKGYFGCCILNFEWIRTAPGIGAVLFYMKWGHARAQRVLNNPLRLCVKQTHSTPNIQILK